MTREMAELMSGPVGPVARTLADAAIAETKKWSDLHEPDAAAMWHDDSRKAVEIHALRVLEELRDYLAVVLAVELVALDLQGAVSIKGAD